MSNMNDMFIEKKYAKSVVIDRSNVNTPGLRVYRDSPFTAHVQFRTATGKQARVTGASFTRAECLELAAYLTEVAGMMDDERRWLDQLNKKKGES
jgi:hypothetical protein